MKSDYIVNVAYLCIHLVCLMSLHYLIAIFLCTKKAQINELVLLWLCRFSITAEKTVIRV